MATVLPAASTLADLSRYDGKAELVGGRIVPIMPTGFLPGQIGGRIYQSLALFADSHGQGVALPDNVGFAVPELSSGRESFSPDASFYAGPLPENSMDFIDGPPTFAVEVRSKWDYGESAEESLEAKRSDYFEAGTVVVWDVDSVADCVRLYRASSPRHPQVFTRGQLANAEPAVPGWTMPVDRIFV